MPLCRLLKCSQENWASLPSLPPGFLPTVESLRSARPCPFAKGTDHAPVRPSPTASDPAVPWAREALRCAAHAHVTTGAGGSSTTRRGPGTPASLPDRDPTPPSPGAPARRSLRRVSGHRVRGVRAYRTAMTCDVESGSGVIQSRSQLAGRGQCRRRCTKAGGPRYTAT